MDINLNNVQHEPIVVSGSLTAVLNRYYIQVASATYTDPITPVEGEGFIVFVRNGTATIGGVAYPVGGLVFRYYHSGSWATYTNLSQQLTGGTFPNSTYTNTDTILQAFENIDVYLGDVLENALASGQIFVGSASGVATARAFTLSATGGTFSLSQNGTLTMPNADASTRGLLTSSDWNTFNNKGSGTVTSVTGSAPVVSSGGTTPAISMAASSTTVDGYLSAANFQILKANSNIFSIFRSGMWLSTPYTSITSGAGWTADSIRAYPIAITKDVTFANIRAEVTTLIAGSNIRLGIATDSNGYPGTIVFDSGNISCASTGMKSAAVNMSFTASDRIIWLLLNMSVGTIGFRYASSTISYLGRPAAGGTTIGGLYRVASAFGAFPASYPAGAATEAHPLNGPLVEIEVA